MTKTVEEVLAEAAIREVQLRYCRAADRVDFELFRSCFHADAELEFDFFLGDVDQFITLARELLQKFVITTHFTGNQLIEVQGDTAWCEFYTLATHRLPADDEGPERDYVTAIRYLDRMEYRDGDWRICRRQCVLDWDRTDPVPAGRAEAGSGKAQRDRSDPSYRSGSTLFHPG